MLVRLIQQAHCHYFGNSVMRQYRTVSWPQKLTIKAISNTIHRLQEPRSGRSSDRGTGVLAMQEKSLESLPDDLLLEILAYMNVQGLLDIAKVSRVLRNVANSRTVWRLKAMQLMFIGRPLVLSGFTTLQDLSTQGLKIAVLRAIKLVEKWSTDSTFDFMLSSGSNFVLEDTKIYTIRQIHALSAEWVSLEFSIPQCLCYIAKFKHFLLPVTRDGILLAFDMETKQILGAYDMIRCIYQNPQVAAKTIGMIRRTTKELIFSGREHYSTKSLYYIVDGGLVSDVEMEFYILRVQFPSTINDEERMQCERIAYFTLPRSYIIEMHILDVAKRMLCIVLTCPSTSILYLFVLFDWDTKESAILNTGIEYKYRKSVISFCRSVDEQNIILRCEQYGYEVHRSYSLVTLRQSITSKANYVLQTPSVASNTPLAPYSIIPPVYESNLLWRDSASSSVSPTLPHPNALPVAETFTCCVWNMFPSWPTFNNVPSRISTIALYWTDYPASGGYRWKIAQHFSTDEGPCPISTTGEEHVSYKRCIIPLCDPAMVPFSGDSAPILGLDYNHISWIEQVQTRWLGWRSKKRVMMLATFPIPGAGRSASDSAYPDSVQSLGGNKEECLKASVRTLDIPENVLDTAYHLLIDSSSATVSITTCNSELYTYQYS